MAIHDVTERLNAHVSIVCSFGGCENTYVYRQKKFSGLLSEYGVVYTVESDTEWIVVVD